MKGTEQNTEVINHLAKYHVSMLFQTWKIVIFHDVRKHLKNGPSRALGFPSTKQDQVYQYYTLTCFVCDQRWALLHRHLYLTRPASSQSLSNFNNEFCKCKNIVVYIRTFSICISQPGIFSRRSKAWPRDLKERKILGAWAIFLALSV